MAGHSQFKNIMHRKGAQDKKRAQIYGRCAKEIIVATRAGGADPETNAALRLAIQKAKQNNLPNDNIARAIKTGSGEGDNAAIYDEVRYEGYGPGGVAVIAEALTDNRNRTAGEVRTAFTKNGGNLGESNTVAFLFDRLGEILYPAKVASNDAVFEAALEAGADNVESNATHHAIYTKPADFAAVEKALREKFGESEKAELTWKPNVTKDVDEDGARSILELIEALEDIDDVQNVYTNFTASDDILQKIAS